MSCCSDNIPLLSGFWWNYLLFMNIHHCVKDSPQLKTWSSCGPNCWSCCSMEQIYFIIKQTYVVITLFCLVSETSYKSLVSFCTEWYHTLWLFFISGRYGAILGRFGDILRQFGDILGRFGAGLGWAVEDCIRLHQTVTLKAISGSYILLVLYHWMGLLQEHR